MGDKIGGHMRTLIIIGVLLITTSVYGSDKKVWYFPATNHTIIDVSGVKTEEQIRNEFKYTKGETVESITKTTDETQKIVDGHLTKYNHKVLDAQIVAAKELDRTEKIERIKTKLGLSNDDWKDLEGAL